jgi:hypothetical protein
LLEQWCSAFFQKFVARSNKLLHHALAVLGADVTLQVAIDRFVKFLLIN